MVTLPLQFVATKYPGYFWNVDTQTLFTMKVTGILRQLKKTKGCYFNNYFEGYVVSSLGCRRYLKDSYLKALVVQDSEVPMIATVNS